MNRYYVEHVPTDTDLIDLQYNSLTDLVLECTKINNPKERVDHFLEKVTNVKTHVGNVKLTKNVARMLILTPCIAIYSGLYALGYAFHVVSKIGIKLLKPEILGGRRYGKYGKPEKYTGSRYKQTLGLIPYYITAVLDALKIRISGPNKFLQETINYDTLTTKYSSLVDWLLSQSNIEELDYYAIIIRYLAGIDDPVVRDEFPYLIKTAIRDIDDHNNKYKYAHMYAYHRRLLWLDAYKSTYLNCIDDIQSYARLYLVCIEIQRHLATKKHILLKNKNVTFENRNSFIHIKSGPVQLLQINKIDDVATNLNQTNAFEALKDEIFFSTKVFISRTSDRSKIIIHDLTSLQTAVGSRLLEAIGSSTRDPERKKQQVSSIHAKIAEFAEFTKDKRITYTMIDDLIWWLFSVNTCGFTDCEAILAHFYENFKFEIILPTSKGGARKKLASTKTRTKKVKNKEKQIHTGPNGGKYTVDPKTNKKRYIKKI